MITLDLRNHGDSFRSETQSYPEMAADLAEVIDAEGGVADVVGHSMGGKVAMTLALTAPERIGRLLVADIAPVSYDHGSGHHDLIAAMQALDLDAISTRSEADAALAEAVATPAVRAFLLQSLDVRAKRWKLNLDVLGRELGTVMGFPDQGVPFEGPVLFLAGALSDYILPEHRARIKALFPQARQAKIPDTGHWLHAEKPREFEAAARAFLNA